MQRIAVATQLASAAEIVRAMGINTAYDTRGDERGVVDDVA